jgi:hypothetical protein
MVFNLRRCTFALGITITQCLFAQTAKYSNEFLNIGVGARSMSMGNCAVSSVNDVTAAYWNPAGLAYIEGTADVAVMHASWFEGIAAYDYMAVAYRYDSIHSFALSAIRFGVDNIPNTLELIDEQGQVRYDRITTFSAVDYGFLLSYARKLNPAISLGGNAKIIYRFTGDFAHAWGFGLDAGLQYKKGKWLAGAILRDATSTFNAWWFNNDNLKEAFELTGNELPENSVEITLPRLIIGVGRKFQLPLNLGLLAVADVDFLFDGERHTLISSSWASIDPHMGLELSYRNLVYVRAGVNNIQKISDFDGKSTIDVQPNLGLGIFYRNLSVDYALTNPGSQASALYSNIFSIRYTFQKSQK